MRLGLVPLSAVLIGLLLAAPTSEAARKPAKPKKPAACKGKKVTAKVGKRRVCVPFAKSFPPPQAVDIRLAYLRQVLKFDPAKAVRGKKRRRVRTLGSDFGAAGRRAQRKLLRLAPKLLAFVDRRSGARSAGAAASSPGVRMGPVPLATASAGCQIGPAGARGTADGGTLGILGNNGGFIEAPMGNGLTARVTFVSCGGVDSFSVPECPKADGSVEAAPAQGEFRATVEIRDGQRVVSRNSSQFEDRSKARGKVAADAKLDYVELEHKQEVLIVASGGVAVRGGALRKIRIDMRTGKYDPDEASVVYTGDWMRSGFGVDGFTRSADAAIRSFRSAEERWSDLGRKPHCAEAEFSPASGSQKLKRGQTGQLSVHAKARDGGTATGAKWALSDPENAEFSPMSSEGPAASVTYTVQQSAPAPAKVRVSVRFTSTAGVGEGTWSQDIDFDAIDKISGTFSQRSEFSGSVFQVSGNVAYAREGPAVLGGPIGFFKATGGLYTIEASGLASQLVTDQCSMKGSGQFAVAKELGFTVIGTGPEQLAPYQYGFEVASEGQPSIPMITIELFDCSEPAKELNGDTFDYPAVFSLTAPGPHTSPDGIDYSGEFTIEQPGAKQANTWHFTGTE